MIKLLGLLGLTLVPSLIGNVQNVDSPSQDVEINQRSLDVGNSITSLEIGKKYCFNNPQSFTDLVFEEISATINDSFDFTVNGIPFGSFQFAYSSYVSATYGHISNINLKPYVVVNGSRQVNMGALVYIAGNHTNTATHLVMPEYFSSNTIWIFETLPTDQTVINFFENNLYDYVVPQPDNLYDVGYDFIHDYLFNSKLDDYSFTFMGESMTMRTWLSHVLTITTIGLVFAFLISIIIWIFKWFGGLFKW